MRSILRSHAPVSRDCKKYPLDSERSGAASRDHQYKYDLKAHERRWRGIAIVSGRAASERLPAAL